MRAVTFLAAMLLCAASAQAAIIQTFTSQAAFLLASPTPDAATITFGPTGPGPVINVSGAVPSISAGVLTLTADPGLLFGNGSVLSTDVDLDTLVLTLSQPLRALGFTAFVSDAGFGAVAGLLSLDLPGGVQARLGTPAGGSAFLGIISDVAFSTARLSVASFDPNVTAVAFPALSGTLFLGVAPTAVPAPGFGALAAPFVALALLRRRRRR